MNMLFVCWSAPLDDVLTQPQPTSVPLTQGQRVTPASTSSNTPSFSFFASISSYMVELVLQPLFLALTALMLLALDSCLHMLPGLESSLGLSKMVIVAMSSMPGAGEFEAEYSDLMCWHTAHNSRLLRHWLVLSWCIPFLIHPSLELLLDLSDHEHSSHQTSTLHWVSHWLYSSQHSFSSHWVWILPSLWKSIKALCFMFISCFWSLLAFLLDIV